VESHPLISNVGGKVESRKGGKCGWEGGKPASKKRKGISARLLRKNERTAVVRLIFYCDYLTALIF